MGNQGLDHYKGALTPEQAAAGINGAARNARRLLNDAKLLLENGRFPSAASLAALSIEESGKVSILRGLAIARDENERRQHWRDYRSHTKKNVEWILPELAGRGARSLEDLRQIFDESSDHPQVLDQVKQIGLYTDCLGKAHWSEPAEVIEEPLARMLVGTAEILALSRDVTVEEMELWVEHLGPVWGGPFAWTKRALVNWYRAAVTRGLIEGDKDAMERFVNEGIRQKSRSD
jgi:AbiV family abortive infection protein